MRLNTSIHAEEIPSNQQPLTLSFILLMSVVTSIAALSLDILLPSLPAISKDLDLHGTDLQQIITFFVLGGVFGELFFGPYSDAFGRKKAIIFGNLIFSFGCLLCIFAQSETSLLVGRILQGIGVSGPKLAGRALLRDLFQGPELARVFSIVFSLYILIPMIAPSLGQWINHVSDWHGIFYFLMAFSLISCLWFSLVQKETLSISHRNPFILRQIIRSAILILKHPKVLGFTLINGLIFGMKLTYLSNAQQMFSAAYGFTDEFPLIFAGLAAWIAVAFFVNARLVRHFGMVYLCYKALGLMLLASGIFLCLTLSFNGLPPFWTVIPIYSSIFFCFGILWGNLGALTMEYLGKVAGIGSTIMSCSSLLIGFGIATWLGSLYKLELTPFASGYFIIALVCIGLFKWSSEHTNTQIIHPAVLSK